MNKKTQIEIPDNGELLDTSSVFDTIHGKVPEKEGISLRMKAFLGITGALIAGVMVDRLFSTGRSVKTTIETLYNKLKEIQ